MTREVWRPIPGTNGKYEISNLGNVKSFVRKSEGKLLRQVKRSHDNGYLCVCIRVNGVRKIIPVHRLVADAFLDKKNGCTDVNHKNEIKTDNRAENLEWCTKAYNNRYGTHTTRSAKSQGKPVIGVFESGYRVEFYSEGEAARNIGVSQSQIYKAITVGKKVGGAIWSWV